MNDRTGFMIENAMGEWWTGTGLGLNAEFTRDPLKGIVFADRRSADEIVYRLHNEVFRFIRVTSHSWMSGEPVR